MTSAESLALAVDLEKLFRELDLKLRNSEVADKSYQEKSEVLGNRIASGVVTGRLTLAEAHYLKDRLDRLSQRESEWRKDGKLTTWHKNGQKRSEGDYVDDKAIGKWTYWYDDGQKKSQGEFKDDKKIGKWTCWDEAGKEITCPKD